MDSSARFCTDDESWLKRRTVADVVIQSGVGLRSGAPCVTTISPGRRGVVINDTPLTPRVLIPNVSRATAVMTARGPVALVEHLLGALWLMGITDAEIAIEGGEPPIFDGSAGRWVEAIAAVELEGEPPYSPVVLERTIEVAEGQACIVATPAERFSARVEVHYPPQQPMVLECGPPGSDMIAAVAHARTFGHLRDREALAAAGVLGGVSLENTVVFDDAGVPLNVDGLRWPDEPVRHKALDLLGDLMCLGRPLQARVVAQCAGHRLHHALLSAIAEA